MGMKGSDHYNRAVELLQDSSLPRIFELPPAGQEALLLQAAQVHAQLAISVALSHLAGVAWRLQAAFDALGDQDRAGTFDDSAGPLVPCGEAWAGMTCLLPIGHDGQHSHIPAVGTPCMPTFTPTGDHPILP